MEWKREAFLNQGPTTEKAQLCQSAFWICEKEEHMGDLFRISLSLSQCESSESLCIKKHNCSDHQSCRATGRAPVFPLIFQSMCVHQMCNILPGLIGIWKDVYETCVKTFLKGTYMCAPNFIVCTRPTACVRAHSLEGTLPSSFSDCFTIVPDRLQSHNKMKGITLCAAYINASIVEDSALGASNFITAISKLKTVLSQQP